MFKAVIRSNLKKTSYYALYSLQKNFLNQSGWLLSFQAGEPLDNLGHPLPWMTYPCIKFLEKRITKTMKVFEYGCGNSTLWWANRVSQVISYEHDWNWYEKLKKQIPPNVELYQAELEYGGNYSKKVTIYQNEFDIVVIDGRDRVNCVKNCLAALKESGVIIWDNTDRDCYQEGYLFLQEHGYRKLDFEGMGPVNSEAWCTSILYKRGNCLDI